MIADRPPAELVQSGQTALADFVAALDEHDGQLFAELRVDRPSLASELEALFASSDFVLTTAIRQPTAFIQFLHRAEYEHAFSDEVLEALVSERLEPAGDFTDLAAAVRQVRQLAQVHIIWRDFLRGDYDETVSATTRLADRLIDFCLERLQAWLIAEMGEPRSADGLTAQRMVVFALGKLGAEELNLSSDVDLIFAYPEPGQLQGSQKTNQAFFLRLAQQLVQVLDNVTAEGFAFRVDMRLRPYGDSGALVLHFPALERYYEEQGRGWERYALIRARVCAGDREAGQELLAALRPFVYRRYLDFGSLEALRDMRMRVDRERRAASMAHNIKLGPGGIRDVEFVVQMQQLTWGGRHPGLQVARTLEAIRRLAELKLLSAHETAVLADGYVFLRDAEHKLQGFADAQTQTLPETRQDQTRLAWLMGARDYDTFLRELDSHREAVAALFQDLVDHDGVAVGEGQWQRIWTDDAAGLTESSGWPGALDEAAQATVVESLRSLREARDKPMVGQEGRDRLNAVMPKLLESAFYSEPFSSEPLYSEPLSSEGGTGGGSALTVDAGVAAIERLVPLLEAVLRRSAYLVLLDENPSALRVLLEICGSSRWMAAELARHPALLDDLLDGRGLFELPEKTQLARELNTRLAHCADPEAAQETLSAFKQSHSFRCAACELRGSLSLMNISDYLTFLAEVVLDAALNLAWEATVADMGEPAEGRRPFAILGYGKLGGLELGPDSDLDVVFVHDLDTQHARFLHRLVRRLMNLLTAHTYSGAMYDVDTRLRPDGISGLMVSSLGSFETYQLNDAWVWEHQALVRARPVAGDSELGRQAMAIRQRILCQARDRTELAAAVAGMRDRIEGAAETTTDLKRKPGGIVDIEFVVQYLVLAWAHEYPALCEFTDNVRILECAARVGLLSEAQRSLLTDAYLALRAERHRSALDIADNDRALEVLQRHRDGVRGIWDALLGPNTPGEDR